MMMATPPYCRYDILEFCHQPAPPLRVGVSWAVDFDVYRQLMAPGGIVNTWMARGWGKMTDAMDRNDAKALLAGEPEEVRKNVLGVRPMDADVDGAMLAQAIVDHQYNLNAKDADFLLECADNAIPGQPDLGITSFGSHHHLDSIQVNDTPIVYRAGWYDAGTA
jgi:predicted acyl esterase